jgi:hypothetical protein
MKTKNTILQLLILVLISLPTLLFAQLDGKNGYVVPVSDTIRVFLVYAETDYTGSPNGQPSIFNTNNWGVDSLGNTTVPTEADSLFDAVAPLSGKLKGWVSGRYQDASMGNYYVLGDYYPEVIVIPYGSNDGSEIAVINALNALNPGDSSLTTANGLTLTLINIFCRLHQRVY